METNHYDVVVCGGDLAGLVAASLLGRRGMRVLFCGFERQAATFQAAGHRLAAGPGLLPPPEWEPAARVLRELNYVQIVRRRAQALHPGLQIVLPRQRLSLGDDEELTAREIAREYPTEAPDLVNALARLRQASASLSPLLASDTTLPPDGFWERREVARVQAQLPAAGADLLAPLPAAHPLRAGLAAMTALSSGLAPTDGNAAVQARAFDRVTRGAFRLPGGSAAVRELFLERLAVSSGEIRAGLVPADIVLRRGRATALRVGPRGETIGLDCLVWAESSASLAALCGERAGARLREIAAGVRPAGFRYARCLVVRPEAVPEGMGPRVIAVQDPSRPLLEDNALSITLGKEAAPVRDAVTLWVECLVPAGAVSSSGALAVVRARVRERLRSVLPFYERHLLLLASPHDGLPPDLAPGEPAAAAVGPSPMTPVFHCDLPRALGVEGAPHRTGLKNVYLAGAENLPGLGCEGDFISGWSVARLIAGPQPRRGLGRKEILLEGG